MSKINGKKRVIHLAPSILLLTMLCGLLVPLIFGSENSTRALTSHGSISYPSAPAALRGVFKHGFEYANPVTSNFREVNPAYFDYDAALVKSWGCNFVRVSFCSTWYKADATYRANIKQWIDKLAAQGIYTVMALFSYGDPPTPGITQGYQKVSEAEAWNVFNTEFKPCLAQVAQDFLYQPFMVGVEINEFWPTTDDSVNWLFDMKASNQLAQAVHPINPALLVLVDVYGQWASDAAINNGMAEITEPNIVFAPHIYSAQLRDGTQLHPTQAGKYGNADGWDWWQTYQAGDYANGKTKMYHWLDLYERGIQTKYNVPFIVTEFAANSDAVGLQMCKDLMDYFKMHNWGFSYFAFYGEDVPTTNYGKVTQLLEGDWITLMPVGDVFKTNL